MALAAFNAFDFDSVRAISDAASYLSSTVFVQYSASTVKYYGAKNLIRLNDIACGTNRRHVIVHLDHCSDIDLIESCIASGWDSIMADYSSLPLQDNIDGMLEIRKIIGQRNIMLEGELGQIAGVEDDFGTSEGTSISPQEVKEFVDNINPDLLAIGIGNAHGFYKSTDQIDIDLLREIHLSVPEQKLVLHGGSGIEEFKIQEMKQYGIYKINISTELKDVYLKSMMEHSISERKFDMVHLVNNRYRCVRELAESKIILFR